MYFVKTPIIFQQILGLMYTYVLECVIIINQDLRISFVLYPQTLTCDRKSLLPRLVVTFSLELRILAGSVVNKNSCPKFTILVK